MRKIALITEGWKRFFTYAIPAGILQRIEESKEDVNLYIFNSSGNWSMDAAYNVGEYNIHRLPNLSEFDGIILDLNNIHHQGAREYIIDAAVKSEKPVISIANEIEGLYYVGIDNEKAIRKVITHLYEEHSCRKFWFVMGPEDNYENCMRIKGLKAFLEEKEIAYQDEDFYADNFEFICGYEGFQKLYQQHDKLPDAVICANDNIAVGVCEAAVKEGYKVPDDFYVTGFDNFDKAVYYTPSLTTVNHIREEVGCACVEIFLKIWNGQEVPRFIYTQTQLETGESCGCPVDKEIDRRQHAKDQILYGIETGDYEEQVIAFENELIQCKTIKEMIGCIPKCIPVFLCDGIYVIVDDRINDFKKQPDYYKKQLIDGEEFCIYGYPAKMNVEFAYENGKNVEEKIKEIEGLFPMFDSVKGGTDFLFLPLHFRDRTVGYFVIKSAGYLMEKQYLFKVVSALTSAMENLHKKEKLEYMNNVLSGLYMKDAMTGLYNRIGYEQLANEMFDEKKATGEDMVVVFLDMDRLKYINDTFGHEYGDEALKITGVSMSRFCPEGGIPVRMGGDEFVLFLPYMEKEKIDGMIQQIREEMHQMATSQNLPFELTVSMGYVQTNVATDKRLDEYVSEADRIMYQEKQSQKVQRGN